MLKTFLKDNKISLARLTSPNRIIPFSNPIIPENIPKEEKQKTISQPTIAMAPVKSPTGRRRKIFQRISSPQSKITANFGEIPNYSTVQSYPIPQEHREKTPKRKNTMKTNKQNGLCLARAVSKDLQRQISMKKIQRIDPQAYESSSPNEHLQSFINGESQRQKRVEQLHRYNRCLENQLNESRKKQQGSLIIVQGGSDFTFQSDKNSIILPKQSLSYSNSLRGSYQEQSMHLTLSETVLTSPLQMHR